MADRHNGWKPIEEAILRETKRHREYLCIVWSVRDRDSGGVLRREDMRGERELLRGRDGIDTSPTGDRETVLVRHRNTSVF